ncbi:MAG TPA: hypothetical protein QF753_17490 [Victivallales bacterium]|nr:hypothetical protein [Victivallales bacterium]
MKYLLTVLALSSVGSILKRKKSSLPSFKNIIEVAHSIDGRVRFIIPSVCHNPEHKKTLENELLKIDGISLIRVSKITGSLLVCFDESKISTFIIFSSVVHLLNLDIDLTNVEGSLTKEAVLIKDSLNRGIYEKTNGILDLKSTVILSLFILATGTFISKKVKTTSRMTFLWWLYNSLH